MIVLNESISVPSTTIDDDAYVPMGDSQPSESVERTIGKMKFLDQPTEIHRHIGEPSDADHPTESVTEYVLVPFLPAIQATHSPRDDEIQFVQAIPTESTIHDSQIRLSSCQATDEKSIISSIAVPRIGKRSISSQETEQMNDETIVGRIKRHRKSTS